MLGGGVGRRARQKQRPARRTVRFPARLRVRPPWWSVAAVSLAVGALLVWQLWPTDAPARQREYRAETACLLTGERGIAEPAAAPVWAGMQDASLATQVKVQYLEVDGPQTAENAETFLASLVQSKCDLVLAVGPAPVGALRATAARFPSVQFVGVGGGTAVANVSVLAADSPDSIRRQTNELVASLAP